MPEYVINGLFMTQQVTGLQRYALELCRAFDLLVPEKHVTMLVPGACDVKKCAEFKNIRIVSYGKHNGLVWEQTDLRTYIKRTKSVCVNFCNVTPLFVKPGITAVHDLMFKLFPEWFTTPRNKLSRIWHTFQADYAVRHEKWIICTSFFTKKVLETQYPDAAGKVVVIPVGWQHVLKFPENENWEESYPFLKKGGFFFSMATRAGNKNGRWIAKAAKNNPEQVFAVAGRSYEPESAEIPKNLHILGYVSDADACSLMKNCKAFICPSYYEGFGDPPLEALALGAKVIVSDRSALPEVFEDSAYYISPDDACIDLNQLLMKETASAEKILAKYSWKQSAEILYNIMYSKKMNRKRLS